MVRVRHLLLAVTVQVLGHGDEGSSFDVCFDGGVTVRFDCDQVEAGRIRPGLPYCNVRRFCLLLLIYFILVKLKDL